MRLKSLDIKGFKSFADRTVINFGEDVIGIVGSNGCGKSNIVDAIRWVLGEQKTKQLRSDSMTSVIFNGTKGRKAAGVAEVSLTFINDRGVLPLEYQEVTIKRALYKDGSSTYELNGVKCRLKDISNLLVDTGMGSDSYAIIALGMVDDLLQDKDNSRLKLFEQAAGISKYKTRKKETYSKLRATEADLDRVEDLLFEIEKNLKSLERQAKRARKYFELKDEYRRLSLELSYFKIAHYKTTYKQLEAQIKIEQANKVALDQAVVQLEKNVEQYKTTNLQLEQELHGEQRALNRLVGRIKGQENDRKILVQKLEFLTQNRDKIDERLADNQRRLEEVERRIDDQSERLDAQHAQGSLLNDQLREAKGHLETVRQRHSSLKQELEGYLEEQQEWSRASFEQEKRLAVLQNQESAAQKSAERLTQNLTQRQKDMGSILDERQALEVQQKTQEVNLQTLQAEEAQRQADLNALVQQLETVRDDLQGQTRTLDAKRNELRLLQDLMKNMEGFSAAIQFLSKQAWSDQAILVSDIFYCAPEYRTALENCLEPYLNYYVVADAPSALQAVALLDEREKGKAQFFILDQLRAASAQASTTIIGTPALEVVQYDAPYTALAEHLLKQVCFVDEVPMPSDCPDEWTLATLDGKWLLRREALKGGSVGAFEGKKIGRKKQVTLLQDEVDTLQQTTSALQDQLRQLQEQQKTLRQANRQSTIQKSEQQLQKTMRELLGLQGKIDSFEQYRQETQEQIKRYYEQAKEQQTQQGEVQQQIDHYQKQLKALRDTVSEKDQNAQEIAAQVAEASTEYNKIHIDQVRHQNTMTAIEKELDFAYRQHKEIKNQKKRDEALLNESGDTLISTQTSINAATTQLDEWNAERNERKVKVEEAEKAYFQARGKSGDTEKEWRDKQRQQTQLLELVHKLEQQFNEVKLQLTSIAERLNVEFEVKINDLVNEQPNPDYDEAVLASNVEQLRKRLHGYGTINPMAIEAYDEIQERHTLITAQRDDLLASKENLVATINEIEEKATAQFMVAFNQARAHFVTVFRSLFHKDDTCDLKLSDPERPLESKIEIVAKPKGKRPLSINQLSGGEKTLTATALLFSLYLLKPAPFCIFDEVDAPLDDANIAKFNNIIQDFSKNSQFIIVTHNKKTMQAVDVMYGVTMVKGISRVVPVDFRALETVQ